MLSQNLLDKLIPDVVKWYQALHREPELGYREIQTSNFIADRLQEFDVVVHRDVSETAVVGVLKAGESDASIMLRAELDALPLQEDTTLTCRSETDGIMHACGHDAHMAMLLGAAKLLSNNRSFDGTVYFVFQPAEEVYGGGKRLVEDGLLDRFPADRVFSLHNWPGVKEGAIVASSGPIMAGVDDFTLVCSGNGAHAAMPEQGDDPILAMAEFISSAQRIVSRTVDPKSALVLSFTQVNAGRINNIVPNVVEVQGTARFFDAKFSDHVAKQLERIADGIGRSHSVQFELDYRKGYPAVVNPCTGARLVRAAAASFLPDDKILGGEPPSLGCEDFSYLLGAVGDGAYFWLGAGDVEARAGLHGDQFVFNEKLFPIGVQMWISLVEKSLLESGNTR